ncbi:hypothetical protein [Clostridium butyricum]|uniref:hypothetical protein n=2 Tax=Clostridiaceae TaxID=31979 RepID=UPI00040CDFAE|nr:hypothetical protein [Clostridium butyricum]
MKINRDNMEFSYKIEKLKSKLNLSADIAKAIDEELLKLNLHENENLDDIAEKIMTVRDGLRDLADFMRENKKTLKV